MKSVLIRLEGPLQSWGTQGRFGIRETDREPSKSGVLGLVAACRGVGRDDLPGLARLTQVEMAVRVDREGSLVRDYHTVGGGRFGGREYGVWVRDEEKPWKGRLGDAALTTRFYLADASFLVALGHEEHALIDEIAGALRAPRWLPFLGRRSCPPAAPLLEGIVDVPPVDALRNATWPVRLGARPEQTLRMLVERADGHPRQDVPLSFESHARRHARRYVALEWVMAKGAEQ